MNIKRKESTYSKVGSVIDKHFGNIGSSLTMLFCVLRACDVIDWQWYWVISPTIIAVLIAFVILAYTSVLTTVLSKRR